MHASTFFQMEELGVWYDRGEWDKLINFGFVNAAYHWAGGQMPFTELIRYTHYDIEEGILVRTLVRLEELFRKIR